MLSPRQRLSRAAIIATSIAVPAEGLRQVAYYDPPGVLTVCYGHTGKDVKPGQSKTIEECRQLLTKDMTEAIDTVDRCVPGLPVHVLAAFGDAVYNLGPTIACDTQRSTAARLLKNGEHLSACQQLPRWNKAKVGGVMVPLPGLTKRRERERVICSEGFA